jgi:hypothetical protein
VLKAPCRLDIATDGREKSILPENVFGGKGEEHPLRAGNRPSDVLPIGNLASKPEQTAIPFSKFPTRSRKIVVQYPSRSASARRRLGWMGPKWHRRQQLPNATTAQWKYDKPGQNSGTSKCCCTCT